MRAYERLLNYVKVWTTSDEESTTSPTTARQFDLAKQLVEEMKGMGIEDAMMDEYGYVYGHIPATPGYENCTAIGFLAHMDTAPDYSGENVNPQIIENYDGKDVVLGTSGRTLTVKDFPSLKNMTGKTLITTDGTTLLGADDKAGIAEIMTVAEELLKGDIPHGNVCLAFTTDEEVGSGACHMDLERFGAPYAYTVDGGPEGEIQFENFNAASGHVTIQGKGIHPGSAKGKMKNALLIAMEFQALLPAFENPMYTEGYEGFYHLDHMEGDVEGAQMAYIIRDHDREKFEQKKAFFEKAAEFLNAKYGAGTVTAVVKDSYYNMKEKIEPHMELIHIAENAMRKNGVTPVNSPVRGGTDGARLSYMGLPCPTLCTGGHNYHGKYEYVCVESMEQTVNILTEIVKSFAVGKNVD